MAISYTDTLELLVGNTISVNVGVYVGLVSNNTSTAYKSDAQTNSKGQFTFTTKPPGDTYTVYTSATGVGLPPTGSWSAYGNSNYAIPVVQGENPAFQSTTELVSSPYANTALPGGADFSTAVRITGGKPWYDITHPTWGGVTTPGADNGGAYNGAIAAASAAGGGSVFTPPIAAGTWFELKTTIVPAGNVTLLGVRRASIVKWTGGTATQVIANAAVAGVNLTNFNIEGLTIDCGLTSGVDAILLNSWQYSEMKSCFLTNLNANATGFRIEATAGTTNVNNSAGNRIYDLRIFPAGVGIVLKSVGAASGPVTTGNFFYGVECFNIATTGVRLVSWCDSNSFHGIHVALTTNGSGFIWNDSATPANNVGVYANDIWHYIFDAFNATSNTYAFVLNNAFDIVCYSVEPSGTYTGLINDIAAGNYWIGEMPPAGNMVWHGKGTNLNLVNSGAVTGAMALGDRSSDSAPTFQGHLRLLSSGGAVGSAGGLEFENSSATAGYGWRLGAPDDGGVAEPLIFMFRTNNVAWTEMARFDAIGRNFVMSNGLRRSRQTPSEAVLVSGVDAAGGEIISVTLTAARLVGLPLNAAIGQNLTFEFTQGGIGAFAVTWNAVFKKTWADTGNATGKISSISFYYNGTNWVQTGAQAPYV